MAGISFGKDREIEHIFPQSGCERPHTMKFKRLPSPTCIALTALTLLVVCFSFTVPQASILSRQRHGFVPPIDLDPVFPWEGTQQGESAAQALVAAIRTATAAAAERIANGSFVERDLEAWGIGNPCAAREELGVRYARRPHAKVLRPNPQLDEVLQQYAALHRTCIRSVGNLTEHFVSGASTPGCKFLVMEVRGLGLGNKVAMLISAILYAVLTQRVILLNRSSLIPLTICEPFRGSSWLLEEHFPLPERQRWEWSFFESWTGRESSVWKSSKFFESGVDARKAGKTAASASAVKVKFFDPEVRRFYCNTEQAFLTELTWLHFSGCLYFLPKLFAVPAFRPALEAIFPDPSLALTYLLRSLMLPRNDVWEEVKRHDQNLFADADHRVGIQVRFLYSRKVYFSSASQLANDHVKRCVAEHTVLQRAGNSSRVTQVLVTSLHESLSAELLRTYSRSSGVRITQLSRRGQQGFSAEEDRVAMVEILLLSLVDELLVTPLSTFGGLAQAYGATRPWLVEVKREGRDCVRAQSVDLCYQTAHARLECPHDPAVNGRDVQSLVPYLRTCLPIEESDGVQLVSPSHRD